MPFRKPAISNAGCQSSMPSLTYFTHFFGVAGSTQYTIGCTGSETAAFGSFFSRRYRVMKRFCATSFSPVSKSVRPCVK